MFNQINIQPSQVFLMNLVKEKRKLYSKNNTCALGVVLEILQVGTISMHLGNEPSSKPKLTGFFPSSNISKDQKALDTLMTRAVIDRGVGNTFLY